MGEQDDVLIGEDVFARKTKEWIELQGMLQRWELSGELPPGLVYNIEPNEAGWHLGVSPEFHVPEDFHGNRDNYLASILTNFWGAIGKLGREKVAAAKKQAVIDVKDEGELAIELRMREILRDQAKRDNAQARRGGNVHQRVSQPPVRLRDK